jgi:ABC-type lipoprotein export system ATPase subunit
VKKGRFSGLFVSQIAKSTSMPHPLLTVQDLSHRFDMRSDRTAAIRATIQLGSFSVCTGSILVVRGASGCGKSTLLHLLSGVLSIGENSGSVVFDEVNLNALTAAARDRLRPRAVGWMPQRNFMINSLSVLDNVLLPVALMGKVDVEINRRAAALLHSLGIDGLARQRPHTLSVGQTARLSLARALLAKPKLLLADEPTAALDEVSAGLVAEQILAFAATGGAVVVASHDRGFQSLLEADPVASVRELILPP